MTDGRKDRLDTGAALGIAAAVSWGLTTMVLRGSRLSSALPEKTLLYPLAVSAAAPGAASVAAGEVWAAGVAGRGRITLVALAAVAAGIVLVNRAQRPA
jgi:drug/metabolite transporter (DMT)-like permease